MSAISKLLPKGNKGVTLSEILISIAILAVTAAPFLESFATAARNNRDSKDIITASSLASKAMDEIKAGFGSYNDGSASYKAFDASGMETSAGLSVAYLIEYVSGDRLTEGAENFNINNVTAHIQHDIARSETETLQDHYLKIKEISGAYYYILTDDPNAEPVTEITGIGEGKKINIKFRFGKGTSYSGKYRLHIDIEGAKTGAVYILDDPGGVSEIINDSNTPYYTYNVSTDNIYDYSADLTDLYKITVNVQKNGETLASLESYIRQ